MSAVIHTEKLTKFYGQHRGMVDIDLDVEAGESFGFLGPNGAGKTTMIRTLLDHIRPTSGRATVFDIETTTDPVAPPPAGLRALRHRHLAAPVAGPVAPPTRFRAAAGADGAYGQPMVDVWGWGGVAASVVLAVGGITLGAWGFRRRDPRGG